MTSSYSTCLLSLISHWKKEMGSPSHTEHYSSAPAKEAGMHQCPTSASPPLLNTNKILAMLEVVHEDSVEIKSRLAAIEEPSCGVDTMKQTGPVARRKRQLSSESLSNIRQDNARRETGTARSGPMPARLNITGFTSYKKLKALVRLDTPYQVLAQHPDLKMVAVRNVTEPS